MTGTEQENIKTILKDWIPFKLSVENGIDYCRWLYLGEDRFMEPFFDETISKCRRLPENSKRFRVISTADVLPAWADKLNPVQMSAIIFHVSRCGSTTISQMLSLDAANIVLPEVP